MPQMKCGACWVAPPPLAKIRAACLYGAASRSLILKFKHGDGLQLVPVFGQILRRAFTSICEPDHLVIPVPLHRWRYLRRRFNQSAELARYLTTTYDIGVFSPALLERVKPTISQGGLNRDQRRRNLRGAFHVSAHHQPVIAGKPVILVDDVITTGATLYEAANCLMRAGSGPVYAIAIARVG